MVKQLSKTNQQTIASQILTNKVTNQCSEKHRKAKTQEGNRMQQKQKQVGQGVI